MKKITKKTLSFVLVIQLILNIGFGVPVFCASAENVSDADVFSEMSFTDSNIFTPINYKINANSIGGWGGASYVKSSMLDFGEQTPYSVTINYAGSTTNPAGINVWAVDSSVDSSEYSASFSNLYDNAGNNISGLYRIASIPSSSLTLDGFGNMHSITVPLSANVTGENRIFISTSNALDLYSIKFSPIDVFSEMSFTNTEFFEAVGYSINSAGYIGGWNRGDYVKSCMLDFGTETPDSVTINYSGASNLVPNIYVWAVDSSVDSSGYYAVNGALYDSNGANVTDTYQVAVIPGASLTLDGFSNMHSVTYTLSKGITGKSRIFVSTSNAANLYSMKFLPVNAFNELSFVNSGIFTLYKYTVKGDFIGGWVGGAYVKSNMLDFGDESPKTVTVKYAGDISQPAGISVWVVDDSVDSSEYYAAYSALYDNNGSNITNQYSVAAIPATSLNLDGFSNVHTITVPVNKEITGKNRVFVATSKAANLYSITFNEEEIPVFEMEVTADEFNSDANTVDFTFNTDVDISSAEFVVSDLNGNRAFAVLETIDGQTASLAFPYGLKSDGEYTVEYAGVIKTDDKSEHSGSFVFTASATPIAVYNASFTDEQGNAFENLDDIFVLNFEYESKNTGSESIIVAQYTGDVLNKCDVYALEDLGQITTYVSDDTEKVKYFFWNIASMSPKFATTVYSRSADWEPQARPLSITGGFYDNSGNDVASVEGHTIITARAKLSASVTPENLTAYLKLVRSGEEIFSDDGEISFDENGIAEVSITYENTNAIAGDVLVFEINDGQSVYYKKQIGYEEASKTVDVLLIAGQSNALGQYADASDSIRPEPDTVYFKTMGNNHLSTKGEIGWAGALGKTWHEETGHTVLIVKAAWGGTGFAENSYGYWNVDYEGGSQRDCYDEAKSLYQAAIESVKANPEYKLGNCVYFWLQGELERNKEYTVEQYSEPFLKMHNGFLNDFGSDDAKLTCGGILPIRAKESEGYPANLGFTGPRIAHYSLAASRDDLQIVSDATEHWYSDEAVKKWFKNEYRNREYEGDTMPLTMAEVLNTDKLHYRQEAHNEFGRQAALSMLAYLNGGVRADGINLITPKGIVHYEDGADIYLTEDSVMPVVSPLCGKKATFTLMDTNAAVMDEYGMIAPKEALLNDYTVLKVSVPGQPDMTFKLYSPLTDDSISIAPVKDNKKAVYTFVSDDGLYSSVSFFNDEFKRLGLRGTVAMVTDWIETPGTGQGWDYGSWDEWRELIGEGYFTIANHTRNHPSFSGQERSVYEYQINSALEKLNEEFPDQKILGVCAPGNYVNDEVTSVTKQRHLSLRRGSHYNDLPATEESLYSVGFKTVTGSTTTIEEMNGWVDSAIAENKWLMEMWHGVDGEGWEPPSKDVATAHFEYIADKKDDIWVADWNEMIIYSLQRLKSRITIVSETEEELVVQITNTSDDTLYDAELTVNIELPDGWNNAEAVVDGAEKDAYTEDGVMSVTIPGGNGTITVTRIN